MVDGRKDSSDVRRTHPTPPKLYLAFPQETRGPLAKSPRSPQALRNILCGLHHYRVYPDNILPAKGGPHGKGGKSDVYMATLVREPDKYNHWQQSTIQVAVKKLRFEDPTNQNKNSKAFVNELKVLDGLCHPNVAKLVGFVEDLERGTAWLVSRWEPHGDVRRFLESAKCTLPERISLVQDILKGLLYLHTHKPPICHGDLKAANILVNASYNAVITDFGSARLLRKQSENGTPPSPARLQTANRSTAHTPPKLERMILESNLTSTDAQSTLRWTAPEVLMGQRPDLPSDIWAAAWTCWEVVTGELPFSETSQEGVVTMSIIEGKVPLSIQGEQMSEIRGLFGLMTQCWALDSRDRPSAGECLAEVRRLPLSIPSSPTRLGFKNRSTTNLRHPAHTNYLTSDPKLTKLMHRRALEIARSTENQLAAANTFLQLGRAYHARGKYHLSEEAYIHAQANYACVGNLAGRALAFEELGSVYRARCQYGDAERSYVHAKNIYTSLKDDLGRASTLCGLGDVYRARCKHKEAEEFYQEARGIHARSGEDRGRANALLGLGEVYSGQCRYREAEEAFLQARDMCSDLRDDLGRANALSGLGDVYRAQSKYGEAEEAYLAAHALHAKAGDQLGRANALLGMGEIHYAQTKYSEAEDMFRQALAIHDQSGNDIDGVNAFLGLGVVYCAQRKYGEAEKNFNQALNLSARTDNDLGRANALRGLGDVHHAQLDYVQAEDSFTLALDLYERAGNDLGSADALLGLGHAYRAQAKWDEAGDSFSHARYIYAHLQNNVGRANALSGLGHVYHALCLYSDAENAYWQAYGLYAGIADGTGKANALLGLGEACVAQSKYDDAEEAFTLSQTMYAEIGNDPGRANVVRALRLLRRDRSKRAGQETLSIKHKHTQLPARGGARCESLGAVRRVPRAAHRSVHQVISRRPKRCRPFSRM